MLVRFFLGVEDDHLLDRIERSLQFVARGTALDLEIADRSLEIAHALHGLPDETLGEQLRILHDELRFFARVRDEVLGHFLRGEERVFEDALAVAVVLEVLAQDGHVARKAVVFAHEPLDLFRDEVEVGADFVGAVAFDRSRECAAG